MIRFFSALEAQDWIHAHHTTYVHQTTQCPINAAMRVYSSVHTFCEHVTHWTPQEMEGARRAIFSIQRRCWTWKCFVLEPSWTLIAVDNSVDGSMPHTIYHAIVVPQWMREALCEPSTHHAFQNAVETLIHEQIHCLQKRYPQSFESLYNSWGYKKVHPSDPHHASILNIRKRLPQRTNPDTPHDWVLFGKWYQTVVFHSNPNSLRSVDYVLIDLEQHTQDTPSVVTISQNNVDTHVAFFGNTPHCYHPDETSAVLLTRMIFHDYTQPPCDTEEYIGVETTPVPAEVKLIKWLRNAPFCSFHDVVES